jgi:peptide/nickel transport system substrate-binding protein
MSRPPNPSSNVNRLRRRIGFCASLVALCLLGGHRAAAKDDLVIGVAQFPSSLHPYIDAQIIKGYILGFAQRPVTSFDQDWKLSCLLCSEVPTLENGLARREADSEGGDGIAVTLRLRVGLTWGDGVPVTAHDIVFTWKRAVDRTSAFSDPRAWQNVRQVDVVDDQTAVLHLTKAVYDYNQWGPLLPEHVEGGSASTGTVDHPRSAYSDTPTNPGLYDGPYIITEYSSGERIVLERNPHWPGPVSSIRRIVIRAIENTAALQANLLAGDIDVTPENIGLTLDQVLALRRQSPERFSYLFRPSLGYEHINLNLSNPILADVRVRRALLLAIDRNTINAKLFEGLQPVAATWVNPLEPTYTSDVPTYGFDPERARTLLAEAGWHPGADGICRNGSGERLSLAFATTAGNRQRELVQQVLQSAWRTVGIEVTIRNEPARTLFGETLKKRLYTGLAMYTYIGEVGGSLRTSLASTMIPSEANGYTGGNTMGFADPAMDRDIASLETELDPQQQKRISADMQRIYAEQLPALPLFFRAEAAVVPVGLKGYALTGHSGYSSRWAEFWHRD